MCCVLGRETIFMASASTSDGNELRNEEETSPDLLKNTPSNIARLEDQIEQCKGRQKYLAQTKSPSDGGDVRWFFCKVTLAQNGRVFDFYFQYIL